MVLAPTTDRDAVDAGAGGHRASTRVGTALGEARHHVAGRAPGRRRRSQDPPPADPSDSPGRILVLTDGANSIPQGHHPRGGRGARGRRPGCPIYTILLGDDPGRPDQPLPGGDPRRRWRPSTGGIFAQSTTTADLQAVFADIGSIVAPVDELRELTVWFAAGAAGLLLLAALIAGLSRPRPPGSGASEPPEPPETPICNVADGGSARFEQRFGVHLGRRWVNSSGAGLRIPLRMARPAGLPRTTREARR